MTNVNSVVPKRRGRPATGRDPLVGFRAPPDLLAKLEAYATREGIPRSEALRRLVEAGLRRSAAVSIFAAVLLVAAVAPVVAEEGFDADVLKNCATIASRGCILKPETRICAPSGGRCWYIGIDNYVAVRRFMGRRILVNTEAGPAVAPTSGLVRTPSE